MKIREKGSHTWDIVVRYHRCPQCGVIIENRENYTCVLGKYVKDLTCHSCGNVFTVTRRNRPATELPD